MKIGNYGLIILLSICCLILIHMDFVTPVFFVTK